MTPVKVWQERVEIPTYETGPQDIHPMFLENRVYQGSSGAVYPYGVTDTLSEQKTLKSWQAVWLENDYIKVMILPELGGRVHRAWDKVKQRDFVYHNEVIKPALVGLLGPWISGGIEFNWPQHHRPTTFMPVDFTLEAHEDGAQTVWVGETEPMHGLQVMTGFTLRPDRAALEIASRVYNGNATPRHFLWWANPAVKGGEGKVTSQFILNQLLRAWQHLDARQPQQACELLHAALHYPENLSEGRLPGQTDNDIWFWQAICANAQGDETEATRCLRLAATGDRTINIHSYYNDQPVDYLFWQGMALRLLGEQQTAQQLFSEMKQWAQEMAKTSIEADFFAVSQPDLLSLYGDLQQQHKEKCLMVAMLASAGLGEVAQYESARAELTAINPAWPKAALFTTVMPFIFNRVH
ncbi:TPA: DUF5107 domain-containing protein [Escherichia coli]